MHPTPAACHGETCSMCPHPATHKVGEEILDDEIRHNLTAYVCCACFGNIMGPTAVAWCYQGRPTPPRGAEE